MTGRKSHPPFFFSFLGASERWGCVLVQQPSILEQGCVLSLARPWIRQQRDKKKKKIDSSVTKPNGAFNFKIYGAARPRFPVSDKQVVRGEHC